MGLPGSGGPKLKQNTRERAISDDQNRAQSKAAQWVAEALRFLLDADNAQDTQSAGVESMGTGAEASLRAIVLSGLRARPDVGTVNLFVTAGAVLLIDNPDPGADDSLAALVTDPGVSLTGVLTLTPGAGSTRIDVVECQRVTSTIESGSRDIFNVTTGLFTPTLVDKVTAGRLTYRIRTGIAGSGFPGVASGWLPLMVARVPSTATTWDDCICWDVRPLAADRVDGGPWRSSRTIAPNPRDYVYTDQTTNIAQVRLYGEIDTTFQGYRAGGTLQKSTAAPYIDITDTDFLAPGFIGFGTNIGQLWHLYAVFPFGLPRWAKYTDSASGSRVPGPLRGIPTVSVVCPNFNGTPASAILQTPTSTGLSDTVGQPAVCLLAAVGDVGAGGAIPRGAHVDGKRVHLDSGFQVVNTVADGATSTTFSLRKGPNVTVGGAAAGFIVPGNAKSVRVLFDMTWALKNPGAFAVTQHALTVDVSANHLGAGVGGFLHAGARDVVITLQAAGTTYAGKMFVDIPLVQPPGLPYAVSNLGLYTILFAITPAIALASPGAVAATILGWDLGP